MLSARPSIGACSSLLRYDERDERAAYIYVASGSGQKAYAGGGGFLTGRDGRFTPRPAITTQWLEGNCAVSSVTGLVSAVDGATWAETSRIALEFEYVFEDASYFYSGEVIEEAVTGINRVRSPMSAASARPDRDRPTVRLSRDRGDRAVTGRINLLVQFSEQVAGFSSGDVALSNARIRAFDGSGEMYHITLETEGSGPVSIAVAENVAFDAAGNGNHASGRIVIGESAAAEPQRRLGAFQQTRAGRLIAQQPGLTGFLSGRAPGGLDVNISPGLGRLAFSSSPGLPLWISTDAAWTTGGQDEARYAFTALGSHVEIAPNLLLGALVEVDYLDKKAGPSRTEGSGWMVGPYVVHRVPGQQLYMEGALLYGRTQNTVSPFGTYSDDFRTERWLLRTKVTGEIAFGSATLWPNLDMTYTTDRAADFTDSRGNVISAGPVSMGRLAAGVDVSVPLSGAVGGFNLIGGIDTGWSHIRLRDNRTPGPTSTDSFGGRVELGLDYSSDAGRSLTLSGHCDTIGAGEQDWCGMGLLYKLVI